MATWGWLRKQMNPEKTRIEMPNFTAKIALYKSSSLVGLYS